MRSFIIAAPASGCGKTTVTLGLMAAFRRRGLTVAPFKVGPDFIDPGYHRLACGRPSINLDGWICPPEFVRSTFAHHVAGADIALIEGVMGLFDGIGGASEEGSTAQVAKLLEAPVVLVADAKGQARSAAALVKGFAVFDPQVHIAGVIFNNVASENHARILREAMSSGCPEVKVFGCIPRDEGLGIPSRHLGLVTAEENPLPEEFLHRLAAAVEQHIDVDAMLESGAGHALPGVQRAAPLRNVGHGAETTPVRIAVARDAAFSFVYEDNLRLLRQAGAEIIEFSPLRDEGLPEGIAGLYLPGGYPEVFAEQLAANVAMKEAVRAAIEGGMPTYAECGGFIYLTRGIRRQGLVSARSGHPQGVPLHELVGVYPVAASMLPRRKALGYREITLAADTVLGPAGTTARGHEFHYSEMEPMPAAIECTYRVRRQDVDLGMEGFRYRHCLASYVHLHFGSCPELAGTMVESCRKYKHESPADTENTGDKQSWILKDSKQ